MRNKAVSRILLLIFITLALSGCFGNKNKSTAVFPVKITLHASADINKNLSGDPSPVVITLFQLKNSLAFNTGDFFSLYKQSKTTLGADLLDSQQLILYPSQEQIINVGINPETNYVGVVAAYSDFQSNQWRTLWPINHKTKKLTIRVNTSGVSIGNK